MGSLRPPSKHEAYVCFVLNLDFSAEKVPFWLIQPISSNGSIISAMVLHNPPRIRTRNLQKSGAFLHSVSSTHLAVTMQSDRARLLDLFAQELRRSALTDRLKDMLALHFSSCAKICCAIAFLPTALLRLSGVDRAAQARSEARNGNSCAPRDVGGNGNT